jgi:hypothetical protein
MTIDGVWIGNWIYCIRTLNYNWVSHNYNWLSQLSLSQLQLSPLWTLSRRLTLLSLLPGPRTSCRPTSQSPNSWLKLLCPWPPSQSPNLVSRTGSLNSRLVSGLCSLGTDRRGKHFLGTDRRENTHCCVFSRYQGTHSSFVDLSGLQRPRHTILLSQI